jgi:hypothetical protein
MTYQLLDGVDAKSNYIYYSTIKPYIAKNLYHEYSKEKDITIG